MLAAEVISTSTASVKVLTVKMLIHVVGSQGPEGMWHSQHHPTNISAPSAEVQSVPLTGYDTMRGRRPE